MGDATLPHAPDNLRVDDLANAVLVREAHHQAVLRRVVLIAVLADQTLARPVVRLALAATTILHLVPLEVRLVLYDLYERHLHKLL